MSIDVDVEKFNLQFTRFMRYVLAKSGEKKFLSFASNETTSSEEGYKLEVYEEARDKLSSKKWVRHYIGTGRIHSSTVDALRLSNNKNNLVDWRLVGKYANKEIIKTDLIEFEEILFDLFKNNREESELFELLVKSLGANYSLIAYFFFIKDKQRFLPVSTERLDKAFELLGITDFKTSHNCSWDNYRMYNLIISEVQSLLNERVEGEVYLLDAHSFLWIISKDIEGEIEGDFADFQWNDPEITTVRREIIARNKSHVFRKKMLLKWGSKCVLTGISNISLLEAAHIKPFAVSSDKERNDPYNGLLLAFHVHRLYDAGLITFDEVGNIKLSSRISKKVIEKFGLSDDLKVEGLEEKHQEYLEYHRKNVFV